MRRLTTWVLWLLLCGLATGAPNGDTGRRLPVAEYRDRMTAGWLGQMIGVGQGAPTEFRWQGGVIPAESVPAWTAAMVNQFGQDDLYVEMTFLQTLQRCGIEPSLREAGIDFANSGYPLWHANKAGRDNLRKGIAPPDSGHPAFNAHADDIDYQIEADFAGLISPGMPGRVIALGEVFGRLMNYGDGIYGGRFVGAMYSEAFFERDPVRIVRAGLACVPAGSQFRECLENVLQWHAENPGDWLSTWDKINRAYHLDPSRRRFSCSGPAGEFNIDAKINAAYIALGLLYGGGDLEQTIVISMRCGQDSDCNPSNAAGILLTALGTGGIPEAYRATPDAESTFSHTPYTFGELIDVCEALARQAVAAGGGRVERDPGGAETFVIPYVQPDPGPLEQSDVPGAAAGSRFSAVEQARIRPPVEPERRCPPADISAAAGSFAPGWTAESCGADMDPGIRRQWGGRSGVLVTHPLSESIPCRLSRQVAVPAGKRTLLRLTVAPDPRGNWVLGILVDGEEVLARPIADEGWTTVTADLSEYAGKDVPVILENRADGWSWEAGYWGAIELVTE